MSHFPWRRKCAVRDHHKMSADVPAFVPLRVEASRFVRQSRSESQHGAAQQEIIMDLRRRHWKIAVAMQYGGDSRSSLYEKAAEHPGLFVKNGRSTLVNLDKYDEILDTRPAAVIKPKPIATTGSTQVATAAAIPGA